jgi:hypothetical protein
VLLLNPCTGGAKANQGFSGDNFDNVAFPSAKAVPSSAAFAKPSSFRSSSVIFDIHLFGLSFQLILVLMMHQFQPKKHSVVLYVTFPKYYPL